MLELVTVMVIAGVLAAVAIPRLVGRTTFDTRGYADQVRAALQFAQSVAVAQRRNVCASFAATGLTSMTRAGAEGAGTPCATPVNNPTTGAAFALPAPSGVSITSPPVTVIFDALGQSVDAAGTPLPGTTTVTVAGNFTTAITVAGTTGYVQ